ncbi:MAG: transposase [Pseudobutyrivibrio sp.]|uniref:transposase n=1 Tax=Pseudobutyrivibrio sp. TaxID=2014367 RepID=UPI0025D5A1D6|nr:transposase [Pseudobutyrivibrio sp.]MBQ6463908.1 transposase [Pseudobutyrivibrio sp.]
MAGKDISTKKYMRNPIIFADFFNGLIYGGKQEIDWAQLQEIDTSMLLKFQAGSRKLKSLQKFRDIIKKSVIMRNDKCFYAILGIENQSDIHYAMPVRDMLYDSLSYLRQVEEISDYNRIEGKCTGEDYISGFTKGDKLIPVVTVTLYWGSKPWDAPTSLKQMLADVDDSLWPFINDYDINLFSIIDREDFPAYKTELRELFLLLNSRNDKQKMQNLVATDKAFSNIKRDTAELMSEFASIQLPSRSKKGGYDMCKAVMEIKQEGIEQGLEQGEENLLDLYAWLKQNNRIEEAEAIMIKENKNLRKKLQLEYKEKANN